MPTLRPARESDVETLLGLQRIYYAEDGYPFVEPRAGASWTQLLTNAALGRVWVVVDADDIVGYVVLTLGFSLEFGGRDAFVDELFVSPAHRGRGYGAAALDAAEAGCADLGVNALHLEVERGKTRTQEFYRRRGFVDHDRYLMTKWFVRRAAL